MLRTRLTDDEMLERAQSEKGDVSKIEPNLSTSDGHDKPLATTFERISPAFESTVDAYKWLAENSSPLISGSESDRG